MCDAVFVRRPSRLAGKRAAMLEIIRRTALCGAEK
jgi:hypothetical protein